MGAEPAAPALAAPVARPTEALVAAIWQRQWLAPGPLLDSAGRALQVVYPGRRWGGPGPDFQGAILALDDGTLVHGDVEVHLRATDWWSHRHDRDPAYNRTVLQVVLWAGRAARRQDGQELPTLELAAHLARPLSSLAAQLVVEREPIEPACLDSSAELLRLVDRAAVERFLEKAGRFESELAALSGAEVVYRAVLVALGYSANVKACTRLAELVPWDLARRVARGPDGAAAARALLLGAAGLLPSQRGLTVERVSRGVWRRSGRSCRLSWADDPLGPRPGDSSPVAPPADRSGAWLAWPSCCPAGPWSTCPSRSSTLFSRHRANRGGQSSSLALGPMNRTGAPGWTSASRAARLVGR